MLNTIKIILLGILISILGLLSYTEWILMTKIIDATVDAKLINLLFFMVGVEVFFIAFFIPIYECLIEAIAPIVYYTTIRFVDLIKLCKGLLYTLLATVVACLILWFLVLIHL